MDSNAFRFFGYNLRLNMRLKLCFFTSIIFFHYSIGQENDRKVIGIVCNDSSVIEMCHVYLKSGLIGTITDSNGSFVLNINDVKNGTDTIVISAIGFAKHYLPVASVSDSIVKITLFSLTEELNEVIILPDGLTAQVIVERAFKNKRKNLPSNRYYMEGFYRLNGFNSKNARLVEAALGFQIFDREFNLYKDEIAVYEVRSSNDLMQTKSWKEKLFDKAIALVVGGNGDLNELYEVLKVFSPHNFSSLYGESWSNLYHFEVKKAFREKNETITYIINFIDNDKGRLRGEYYINSDNWKILKEKYMLYNPEYAGKLDNKPITSELHYQEINNRMYPLYVEHKVLGGKHSSLEYKDEEGNSVYQYHKKYFFVNMVDPKMRNHRKKFKQSVIDRYADFNPKSFCYNPAFWESYNMLELNPQSKKQIEDLSENISLEEQFIHNGKVK